MKTDYSKVTHYLAIIEAGHGAGSWSHDAVALDAINRVVRIAKDDWKFARGLVHVYDLSNADLFTTGTNPKNSETGQPLPYLYSVQAQAETPPRRARK